MDRAVVEARAHRGAHEPVLVDAAEALELGRAHDRAQVIAAALVEHLDLGAWKRGADHLLELSEVGGHQANLVRVPAVACRVEHLFDGGELDSRPAERLAAADLGPVDRLPASERDDVGHTL